MRANPMMLLPLLLLAPAGAPAHYLYGFDLTDPGAKNFADFRRPDAMEDGDTKLEVRADPDEFKAIAFDVTNKTDGPLQVNWAGVVLVAPDGTQSQLRADNPPYVVEPGAKISVVMRPFELPGGAVVGLAGEPAG